MTKYTVKYKSFKLPNGEYSETLIILDSELFMTFDNYHEPFCDVMLRSITTTRLYDTERCILKMGTVRSSGEFDNKITFNACNLGKPLIIWHRFLKGSKIGIRVADGNPKDMVVYCEFIKKLNSVDFLMNEGK